MGSRQPHTPMRYLTVAVHQPPDERHPMHQFVVEREGYDGSRLLAFDRPADAASAFLFHVEGPREPYEAALAAVPTVVEYEISPCPDGSFYLYVREDLADTDREFVEAVSQPGLVGVLPVEYRPDGTVRLTAVGPAAKLQAAVEATPERMDVEVVAVGDYEARGVGPESDLTDRQFEAVAAAVDCGYYEVPREGTAADVADRLDCAPGTAAELLRRAERTVLHRVVSAGPY